jgi:hypothetical protein
VRHGDECCKVQEFRHHFATFRCVCDPAQPAEHTSALRCGSNGPESPPLLRAPRPVRRARFANTGPGPVRRQKACKRGCKMHTHAETWPRRADRRFARVCPSTGGKDGSISPASTSHAAPSLRPRPATGKPHPPAPLDTKESPKQQLWPAFQALAEKPTSSWRGTREVYSVGSACSVGRNLQGGCPTQHGALRAPPTSNIPDVVARAPAGLHLRPWRWRSPSRAPPHCRTASGGPVGMQGAWGIRGGVEKRFRGVMISVQEDDVTRMGGAGCKRLCAYRGHSHAAGCTT